MHAAVLRNGGANWSALSKARMYRIDSKRCFGIIRAALSFLNSVDDLPHNPKVAGSNPAPATNPFKNFRRPLRISEASLVVP